MSEAIGCMGEFEFRGLLRRVLQERRDWAEAPAGMEQRLRARLAQDRLTVRAPLFGVGEAVRPRQSAGSLWWAMGLHGAVLLVVLAVASRRMEMTLATKSAMTAVLIAPRTTPPVAVRAERTGGGGGHADNVPVTQGRLPKFAERRVLPLKTPPMDAPRLAVEPTINVQTDLKMATNDMPNLGDPRSSVRGVSMGAGAGMGMGDGAGNGFGPGSGANAGGGPMHIGNGVLAPQVLVQAEAEFSEEARKAKFSGNVEVYLWVDKQGNPSHIRVVRGVGMGLDERAVEAVRKFRFRPAMKDGKPVAADMYIDVNFQIL